MKSTIAVAGGAVGLLALTWVAQSTPAVGAAASSLVTLDDPVTHSKGRVDSGKARVGDGSGPLTVDGTIKTAPTSTTLSGEVVLPAGSPHVVLPMAPPACPAGQVFLVEELSGSPSPTALHPNGDHEARSTVAWGATVPLTQRLADGTSRPSALAFAISPQATGYLNGTLNGEAPARGGVPARLDGGRLAVTVEAFSEGHADLTFDVQVTGRCGTPPPLP